MKGNNMSFPILDYSRSIQMPYTDQITEIAPNLRIYFWVFTILNKYHRINLNSSPPEYEPQLRALVVKLGITAIHLTNIYKI